MYIYVYLHVCLTHTISWFFSSFSTPRIVACVAVLNASTRSEKTLAATPVPMFSSTNLSRFCANKSSIWKTTNKITFSQTFLLKWHNQTMNIGQMCHVHVGCFAWSDMLKLNFFVISLLLVRATDNVRVHYFTSGNVRGPPLVNNGQYLNSMILINNGIMSMQVNLQTQWFYYLVLFLHRQPATRWDCIEYHQLKQT